MQKLLWGVVFGGAWLITLGVVRAEAGFVRFFEGERPYLERRYYQLPPPLRDRFGRPTGQVWGRSGLRADRSFRELLLGMEALEVLGKPLCPAPEPLAEYLNVTYQKDELRFSVERLNAAEKMRDAEKIDRLIKDLSQNPVLVLIKNGVLDDHFWSVIQLEWLLVLGYSIRERKLVVLNTNQQLYQISMGCFLQLWGWNVSDPSKPEYSAEVNYFFEKAKMTLHTWIAIGGRSYSQVPFPQRLLPDYHQVVLQKEKEADGGDDLLSILHAY